MKLVRIRPLSLAKVLGVCHAIVGLLIGILLTLFSIASMAATPDGNMYGLLFGVGAIIFMPIFCGVMGFVTGLVSAYLYNHVSDWVGGIEIDLK